MAEQKKAASVDDLDSNPDFSGLFAKPAAGNPGPYAAALAAGSPGPYVVQGSDPEHPYEMDALSMGQRIMGSFGDEKGNADLLNTIKGLRNAQVNKAGVPVAQNDYGSWVRDADSHFTENPLNWTASRLGYSLPLAGAVYGETKLAPGGFLGMVAGGGLGALTGEIGRQAIGKMAGTHKGATDEALPGLGKAGLDGALGSAVGAAIAGPVGRKVVGKVVEPAYRWTKDYTMKRLLPSISELLTGVDSAAWVQHYTRPAQSRAVQKMMKSGRSVVSLTDQILARGEAALDEAYTRLSDFRNNIPRAEYSSKLIPTQSVYDRTLNFVDSLPADTGSRTAIKPEERAAVIAFLDDHLSVGAKGPKKVRGAMGEPTWIDREYPMKVKSLEDLDHMTMYDGRLTQNATTKQAQLTPLAPINNSKDLATPYARSHEEPINAIRDLIEKHNPALAAERRRFSDFKNDMEVLRKIFGTPDARESFLTNIHGANHGGTRRILDERIPGAVEEMKDVRAHKATNVQGGSGSLPGARNMTALAGSMGLAGMAGHSPLLALASPIPWIITRPSVNRSFYRGMATALPALERAAPYGQSYLLQSQGDNMREGLGEAKDALGEALWTLMDQQNKKRTQGTQ